MTARGFFTVLAATATAGVAYFALMPTHVEVPTLPLPDLVLETTEINLPFWSFDPDDSTIRVDCGSMVSPADIQRADSNAIGEFFGQPEEIERRARAGCDESHDRRWQLVIVSLIGAGMLIGFAVVSGRRPAGTALVTHPPPPPEPRWPHPIEPSVHLTGPPIVPTRTATPPTSPPTTPPASPPIAPSAGAPPIAGDSATAVGPARRKQLVGATAAGLVAIVVLGGVTGIGRGTAPTALLGRSESTIDPALVAARACTSDAFASIDSGYAQAQILSAADRDESSINLDGDASWQGYSDTLRALDLSGCSVEFRTTAVELANAWGAFGDDWIGSTKGFSLDKLSDEDFQRHETRINAARRLLEELAADIDVEVRLVNYNLN